MLSTIIWKSYLILSFVLVGPTGVTAISKKQAIVTELASTVHSHDNDVDVQSRSTSSSRIVDALHRNIDSFNDIKGNKNPKTTLDLTGMGYNVGSTMDSHSTTTKEQIIHKRQSNKEYDNLPLGDSHVHNYQYKEQQHHHQRQLSDNSISNLFNTPISQWSLEQAALFIVLLALIMLLCGCMVLPSLCCCCPGGGGYYGGGQPYYGGGYGYGYGPQYYSRGGGGSCCDCLCEMLMCWWCFTLCCDNPDMMAPQPGMDYDNMC